MDISLKKNKYIERLLLLIPSACCVGAIYFLSFFSVWCNGAYVGSYNYEYCLPVGIAFMAGTIVSLVLLFRFYKYNKSNVPIEIKAVLLTIAVCLIILWEILFCEYCYGGSLFVYGYFGVGRSHRYSVMLVTLWVICLPAAYLFVLMIYGTIKQVKGGYCLKSSLIYRAVYHFTGNESIRSSINIYVAISFICTMVFLPPLWVFGIFFANAGYEYVPLVPLVLCVTAVAAFASESALILSFINSKKSVIRDADRSVKEAIEKGIASERLKVELITNVSHDLRTPMTSIVGYGEMLERMELPEEAQECVKRLNHKSGYLLSMLEDVFDMSKTSTGNAVINRTDIDLVMLINQTLAECEDRLKQTERKLCVNIEGDSIIINTDGNRMHRVFSNLIDNAIKYSLKGTRIFVNVKTVEGKAVVEIMNTSAYEMDFTPERITERFVRGNSERTGEGSGIGLAIAKTYTEGLGGSFEIELKGDLFNAIVKLPLDGPVHEAKELLKN